MAGLGSYVDGAGVQRPSVGDCVVRIVTTTGGNLIWGISAMYHTHPGLGA